VFASVGTNYLNIDVKGSGLARYLFPLATSQFKRVARIRDYADSRAKIIASDPICEAVALSLDVGREQFAQPLLDCVNSHVGATQTSCRTLRERCLPAAREARKDVKDRFFACHVGSLDAQQRLDGFFIKPLLAF
jgi:hypothetical protein